MSRHRVAFTWTLLLWLIFVEAAQAFVDSPVLVPEHPQAGETVSVSIHVGECDSFMEAPGFPQVTQDGSAIRILLRAVNVEDIEWCNLPVGTLVAPVGAFPAGSYTLQVDRIYQEWLGYEDIVETLGVLSFTVAGTPAPPVAAPSLNGFGLVASLLALLCVAAFWLRRGALPLLMILMALLSVPAHAEETSIALLISNSPGAPTPQAVVNYYAVQPRAGTPPLSALAATNPQQVFLLLPRRASGDFLGWLKMNPSSTRAKLERYLIVRYAPGTNLTSALSTLRADLNVDAAYLQEPYTLSSVDLVDFNVGEGVNGHETQYGRDALNIDAAWQVAGGYALVGAIDTGLATEHPGLRQFNPNGQYVGGNFIPVASLDIGDWPDGLDGNVDEAEPLPLPLNSICNPKHLPAVPPFAAGHGTHVSGLVAANADAGLGVKGICRKCGIAMWRITKTYCDEISSVTVTLNSNAIDAAITFLGDIGAQVTTMSFGRDRPPNYCPDNPDDPRCLALAYANYRDIAQVGASGNQRKRIQAPASDDRVIAAGGFQQNLLIWDESPGNNVNCPLPGGAECGSNYTTIPGDPKQELMGSAKSVLSTIYPGYDWNNIGCGDSFLTPTGDGIGGCTGTSMSSPQVAGVAALVRSVNPLVPVGKPTFNPLFEKASLRSVLASTTAEAHAGQGWTPTLGHGHPDAAAAARKMLGKVAGAPIRNRATPLFRLYSSVTKDYADVTSPQYAYSLIINQANAYQPQGTPVPNYTFPIEPGTTALPTPRASAYVMTTEFRPRNEWPGLVPLYLMDKTTPEGFDFMLVTTTAHIQTAHNAAYNLRNIQGYIYQPCTPEPGCIPPLAEKFYRACKIADNDCATFLESERSTFEAAGYTAAYPTGSNKVLGYAYPATDADLNANGQPVGDGLPDGFEYVVGTSPTRPNSDNDTSPDASEFPMVGVPVSDPCGDVGSAGARYCLADSIFKNGFDQP